MMITIRKIAEWGIRTDTSPEQAQHYRLTNVLLVLFIFGSLLETLVCFVVGAYQAALLNCTAPFLFAAGLLFMKSGYTTTARLLVLVIGYAASYVFVAALGPESYFQIILLFASAFSLVLFSSEEKWPLAFGIVAPLICFALLEANQYAPVFGMSRAQFTPSQLLVVRMTSLTLVWVLMVSHFFYFLRERRRSQEQLVSSAKMVAMGNMAAGIAHEINNPLQVIVSYADRLKAMATSAGAKEVPIAAAADKIQSVAKRIGAINTGLLALSRDASKDPFEVVYVRSLVQMSLEFCRSHIESHKVELRTNEIPDDWCVSGRETQLSEVLLNVLNNAYSAVSECEEKWIQIQTSASKDWIEIAVSDSGPGVDPKVVDHIFEPFFTTKPIGKGTGLGLSISRKILAAHGGRIEYKSSSKGGAFLIRIPRLHEPSLTLS